LAIKDLVETPAAGLARRVLLLISNGNTATRVKSSVFESVTKNQPSVPNETAATGASTPREATVITRFPACSSTTARGEPVR
jgi:hypothetical protein